MTEELTCKDCGTTWTREVVRGRKPTKCDECKGGKPKAKKPAPVLPDTLKAAEKKYKARVQMQGQNIKWLGEGQPYNDNFMLYMGFETADGVVTRGSIVRRKGFAERYKIQSIAVRKDGTGYANCIGVAGPYEGKYRALGIEELSY